MTTSLDPAPDIADGQIWRRNRDRRLVRVRHVYKNDPFQRTPYKSWRDWDIVWESVDGVRAAGCTFAYNFVRNYASERDAR